MANREEKKVVINPTIRGRNGNVENWFNALISWAKAAKKIAGIPRRNENLAASFLSHPYKSAMEIVAPERDTPGIMAKAWARPI